jgi:hypothetical protein
MEDHMPHENTPAPGTALNAYLEACERLLDAYKNHQISWSTMFDRRDQAVAKLNGQLVDHFLIRAHNRRELSSPAGERRDVRSQA